MRGKHTMEEYEVISIPVSDGTERDFAIMDTFEFEGQGYLAVSLIEGDEIQEGVYIYRYHNAEDGDVVVEQITFCRIQKGDKILRTDVSKKISRKEPASCDKIKKKIKF